MTDVIVGISQIFAILDMRYTSGGVERVKILYPIFDAKTVKEGDDYGASLPLLRLG